MGAGRDPNVGTDRVSIDALLDSIKNGEMTEDEVIGVLSQPEEFKRLVKSSYDMDKVSAALGVEAVRNIWDAFLADPQVIKDLIRYNNALLEVLFFAVLDENSDLPSGEYDEREIKVLSDKKPHFPDEFLSYCLRLIVNPYYFQTIFLMKAVQALMPADYISIKDLKPHAEKLFLDFLSSDDRNRKEFTKNLRCFSAVSCILSDENAAILEEEIPRLLASASSARKAGQLVVDDLFRGEEFIATLRRFKKYQKEMIAFAFSHEILYRHVMYYENSSFNCFNKMVIEFPNCIEAITTHVLSDPKLFICCFQYPIGSSSTKFMNGETRLSFFLNAVSPANRERIFRYLYSHEDVAAAVLTEPMDIVCFMNELPNSLITGMTQFFSRSVMSRVILQGSPEFYKEMSARYLLFRERFMGCILVPHPSIFGCLSSAGDPKVWKKTAQAIYALNRKKKDANSLSGLALLSIRGDVPAFAVPTLCEEIGPLISNYYFRRSAQKDPGCYRYYHPPLSLSASSTATVFGGVAATEEKEKRGRKRTADQDDEDYEDDQDIGKRSRKFHRCE
ncbi:MAG TPA: hypothetical protein VNC84_06905 [Gammaproteobacteria bacterium]|jgi:hypothetical protein|nr:hypothetical protein [Gammaproteobacteria bacterium]